MRCLLVAMASQRGKTDNTIKDLLSKSTSKHTECPRDRSSPTRPQPTPSQGDKVEEEAPVTRSFIETLFLTFHDDITSLKQEVACTIKDIHRKLSDVSQRVDTIKQAGNAKEEELEACRCERLELQDQNADLNYLLKDLENRSRRANISIKGVPLHADLDKLEDSMLRLFRHIVPALADKEILLDHTHRAGAHGSHKTF
ncbi:hypothetical protein NDU88_008947 [Pleurodeles waltl]|uniref:Uncharacterized protein n=1 Tax=Pleurodeles waltl TaxID=8319 RepID=A0AAV7RZ43_PLEWA|nr:hypothetical protein NDU88_008947 [Pleurodeles waltl]